jgi:hypothetical protein
VFVMTEPSLYMSPYTAIEWLRSDSNVMPEDVLVLCCTAQMTTQESLSGPLLVKLCIDECCLPESRIRQICCFLVLSIILHMLGHKRRLHSAHQTWCTVTAAASRIK